MIRICRQPVLDIPKDFLDFIEFHQTSLLLWRPESFRSPFHPNPCLSTYFYLSYLFFAFRWVFLIPWLSFTEFSLVAEAAIHSFPFSFVLLFSQFSSLKSTSYVFWFTYRGHSVTKFFLDFTGYFVCIHKNVFLITQIPIFLLCLVNPFNFLVIFCPVSP